MPAAMVVRDNPVAAATLVTAPYVLVEGILQNQQGAISVKLRNVEALAFDTATPMSHDFR